MYGWRSHLVDGGLVQLDQALHHLPAHHGEEAEEQDHACDHGVHSKRRFSKNQAGHFFHFRKFPLFLLLNGN